MKPWRRKNGDAASGMIACVSCGAIVHVRVRLSVRKAVTSAISQSSECSDGMQRSPEDQPFFLSMSASVSPRERLVPRPLVIFSSAEGRGSARREGNEREWEREREEEMERREAWWAEGGGCGGSSLIDVRSSLL